MRISDWSSDVCSSDLIRIGLGGCDMASSYFLPRLVGASLAAEMILTGRFIDAGRALSAGLVSEIVDEDELLDRGIALAGEMLATSPHGLRLSKQALNLRSEEHTSELQSLMRISYAVFCLKKKKIKQTTTASHEKYS